MLDREIFSILDSQHFTTMGLFFGPLLEWSRTDDEVLQHGEQDRIWELRWLRADEDPHLLGRPIKENPANHIAAQAAQGIPVFERAWLLFVRLELEGRVQVKHKVRRPILRMAAPMVQQIPRPKKKGQ